METENTATSGEERVILFGTWFSWVCEGAGRERSDKASTQKDRRGGSSLRQGSLTTVLSGVCQLGYGRHRKVGGTGRGPETHVGTGLGQRQV